jgi:hypothetical protein
MSFTLRKMALSNGPYPDPHTLRDRHAADVKAGSQPQEPTAKLYVGLDRVCRDPNTGKEFRSDATGHVHIPRSLQKSAYLVPSEVDEYAAMEEHELLPPPRQSGRTWHDFLRRRIG